MISAAYRSAIRWDWTTTNPAHQATPLSTPRPCPRPPAPDDVARILTEAWQQVDPFLAVAIWIAITTGARRGELCALRWSDFDAANHVIHIRASISHTSDGLVEKDTKLHEERRVVVDHDTAYLLAAYHDLRRQRALADGKPLAADAFILSLAADGSVCLAPASLGQRFCRLVRSLGIPTTLHKLRHYNATELILAGVDLRTVASRLGHRDASTTLTTYTAWIAEANQPASTQLHDRLPLRLSTRPHHTPRRDTAVAARPSRSRAWEIATDLRDAITHRQHRPGQQLPPIKTLATYFGVAPSTMHRAVTHLAQLNLVTTAPGRPTTVVPNPPTIPARTRSALPPLTSQPQHEQPPQRWRPRHSHQRKNTRRPRVAGHMPLHRGGRSRANA
ncbi:hypothetical protein ALI144C_13670 [Actinosynnema sp. ALI-1.44]|uniref:tyrosine-type recombinase/integrase n=1 Tax=Actinosynnema sp. ALI-1.44 TaxID=1933779 RepID=UPI00097BEF45|nr:tyrosine-type recombinase/integrase [Actinosynnema sp. ALI-1.44]ONI85343.1 hypothetical protein ALI144C_13670 [Actinosynnema sp. ALI-1.44]